MLCGARRRWPRTASASPAPTTDKTVTFFCFGVIAFFALLPIVLSLIQGKLEKRKDGRRCDLDERILLLQGDRLRRSRASTLAPASLP